MDSIKIARYKKVPGSFFIYQTSIRLKKILYGGGALRYFASVFA